MKCTLNCWLLNFSGWIIPATIAISVCSGKSQVFLLFPTDKIKIWNNLATLPLSCRELKWGGSKDERVNPPESERERWREREREEKRKSVRTKVFAFALRQLISISLSEFFFPHPFPSHRTGSSWSVQKVHRWGD